MVQTEDMRVAPAGQDEERLQRPGGARVVVDVPDWDELNQRVHNDQAGV